MKTIFLTLFCTLFIATFANAQVFVNGVNINEIEDLQVFRIFSASPTNVIKKPKIVVDYGQGLENIRYKKAVIKDKAGTIIQIKTVINAINFFENNGWKMFETETQIIGDTENTESCTYYYFRRK